MILQEELNKKVGNTCSINYINKKEAYVCVDVFNSEDELVKKNHYISLSELDNTKAYPDKTWKIKHIKQWLKERRIKFLWWLPFKSYLLIHVDNYKTILNNE